uniref:Alcohol dehydrogenase 1 n=1 Tax=Betula platyphylla TaxID=78630 RepID=A0A7D7KH02_BETPL|nr:alcohol dehydrogenase 1 [Betula platyphylla]
MSSATANEDCLGWAARDESGVLSPYKFSRRAVGRDDVSIKITHCGVCYADVGWTRNKNGDAKYPVVPGHEIAGIVREVGTDVHHFKVGDHVGVGTYVNSCRDCEFCNKKLEANCAKGAIYTFNGIDTDGTVTKGGYSDYIVVHERQVFYNVVTLLQENETIAIALPGFKGIPQELIVYCFTIPDSYPLASAAPLLCAGITVYAPMMRYKMNQPGKSLGVIGLGGLGHMAVKFGKAFGLNVTVFSTSISKREEALSLLGADKFVVSSDQEEMQALVKSLDFIIDTASGEHPLDPYISILKTAGVLVVVGAPSELKFKPVGLFIEMRTIAGSVVGGTKDIQEMLNFCAAHRIYPQIEVVPIQYANEALERLVKNDVKFRFVIDIENSLK